MKQLKIPHFLNGGHGWLTAVWKISVIIGTVVVVGGALFAATRNYLTVDLNRQMIESSRILIRGIEAKMNTADSSLVLRLEKQSERITLIEHVLIKDGVIDSLIRLDLRQIKSKLQIPID